MIPLESFGIPGRFRDYKIEGLWKFIRRGWDGFVRFVRCDVEDGSKVRFWHELWRSNLKERFPDLYLLA